jgi:hypothetical protein
MRQRLLAPVLALTLCAGAALPARAEDAPPYHPLRIPLPEKAQVSVEVDAHQDDLIGVVKSMLKGLNIPALMKMMQGMGANTGISFPDVAPNGEPLPQPGAPGSHPGAPGVALAPSATVQTAPNFADLLKDIHQLHMVVFKAEGWTPDQAIKFYEQPFAEEGGRRVLWINHGENRMLMVGFSKPHGFAIVIPAAEEITVIRADGYPDLEGVGSFVTMLGALVGSMRGMSDIFNNPTAEPDEPPTAMPVPPPAPMQRGVKRRPASLVAPKPTQKGHTARPSKK